MERSYWLARSLIAEAMARKAATAEARLIHYDLAGRYSIKAAASPQSQSTAANAREPARAPELDMGAGSRFQSYSRQPRPALRLVSSMPAREPRPS